MIPEADAFLRDLIDRYQPAPEFVERIRGPVERIFQGGFTSEDRRRLLRLAEETVRRHAENRRVLEKARGEIREAMANLYSSFFGRLVPFLDPSASHIQEAGAEGRIPPTLPEPLLFGQFLLSRGILSRDLLGRALAEQERRRPALGELAVAEGLINRAELYYVLEEQQESRSLFGEAAIKSGYLRKDHVEALLKRQKQETPRIGDLLVEGGTLGRRELEALLQEFHRLQGRRAAS